MLGFDHVINPLYANELIPVLSPERLIKLMMSPMDFSDLDLVYYSSRMNQENGEVTDKYQKNERIIYSNIAHTEVRAGGVVYLTFNKPLEFKQAEMLVKAVLEMSKWTSMYIIGFAIPYFKTLAALRFGIERKKILDLYMLLNPELGEIKIEQLKNSLAVNQRPKSTEEII